MAKLGSTQETGSENAVVVELRNLQRLFFAMMIDPKKNQRERIELLAQAGFNARDIAGIIGSTSDIVGAQLRKSRRSAS